MIKRLIWTIWTTMSSVLKKADKLNLSLSLVFHQEEFQLPVSSQCWEMIENANISSCLLTPAYQGLKTIFAPLNTSIPPTDGATCIFSWRRGPVPIWPLIVLGSIYLWMIYHSLWNELTNMRLEQNGCHFADNIFRCIFLKENVWISVEISLKFVPRGPINNIPALV